MSARPLEGRRVVVTRARRGESARRLEAAGAEVLHLPAIERAPPSDSRPLEHALLQMDAFDELVFTSAEAVRAVVAAAARLGVDPFVGREVSAVGPTTAAALEAAGVCVARVGRGGGAALVEGYPSGALRGRHVLLPRAEGGRDDFPEAARAEGATVEVVAAYRTLERPEAGRVLAAHLEAGGVDAVTFASPSAARSVLDGLAAAGADLGDTLAAAIGQTTAATLRELGAHRLVVARAPSAAALAEAVIDALG